MRKIIILSIFIFALVALSGCAQQPSTRTTTSPGETSPPTVTPAETTVVPVPTLGGPPSAINAKTSFYGDIKGVPAIEGMELVMVKYTKPPAIGEYRSTAALKNYQIEATYLKDGGQSFSLPMESLTQDGIKAFNSQTSAQQPQAIAEIRKTVESPTGTPQPTPPPSTSTTTTKTIDGVTVYIRNSTYYYLVQPDNAIASNSNFEYRWIKDSISYSMTGSGYKNPNGESDPTSEMISTTEKIIKASGIELKNYGFLGMKEYLPEPPSSWNLYLIEAAKPTTGYAQVGTTGVAGTYAKEAYEGQGQYGLKNIKATILFGTAQMPVTELLENSTMTIANRNVLAGYTYRYTYEKQVMQPYMKEQQEPPQMVKQRDSYVILWIDRERYATMYVETKADLQPEYESVMKQFMTDILNVVYK